jgi:hypothetical protein
VLSVELRDPAWQAWLLRFGMLSVLVDGSVLFAHGSSSRAVYTALTVPLVAGASLYGIGPSAVSAHAPPRRLGAAVRPLIGGGG